MIKESIYKNLKIPPDHVFFNKWGSKDSVSFHEVLPFILEGLSGPNVASKFNRSPQSFNRAVKKLLPSVKLSGGQSWQQYFLWKSDFKKCHNCKTIKDKSLFTTDNSNYDGLDKHCKSCKAEKNKHWYDNNKEYHIQYLINNRANFNANTAKRRARLLQAIPPWADLEKIRDIYNSCPVGYHVDHIIPLKGRNICGLHVESNLQHLPAEDNLKKSNKFMG